MRGDEVVAMVGSGLPVAEVGGFGGEAVLVGVGAADEGIEHPGAGVYGVDLDLWVSAKEAGGETAVAVAENEGVAAMGEFG